MPALVFIQEGTIRTMRKKTRRRKRGVVSFQQKVFPYLMIAPNTFIFVCFVLVPAVFGIYYSLTKWNGLAEPVFIGLANYMKAFRDMKFWRAFGRTALYALITLPLVMTISLLLANLMIQRIPGKGVFRAIIYWPAMISYIVIGVSFKFIFSDSTGIINYLLSRAGFSEVNWLMDSRYALAVVILATIWSCAGYYMIMYMSGLQNISESYYEAAKVDGANAFQRFFSITLPLIRPTTFLIMILSFLNLFKAYGMVISLTGGGPASATKFAVQFIYEKAFSEYDMGYACTLSMILMLVLAVFTVLQFKINRGGEIND